jgi:alpha-tubulin suppressor-like RCC1 family protein
MNWNSMKHIAMSVALLTLVVAACQFDGLGGLGRGTYTPMPPWLWFAAQPSAVPAGVKIFPAVAVTFVDVQQGYNDSCTDQRVTLALSGTTGATLGGTVTQAAVNGVATFADLSVDRPGTFSLTATAPCVTAAYSGQFTITGPVVSVSIAPPNPGLTALGATLKLGAQARDAANIASGGRYTWTSTDTTKVLVSADGLVTALAYGSATITATTGGVSGSTHVTVAPMAGALASLSAGGYNTCGVTTGGAAYCWGDNSYGQLGIGAADPFLYHTTPFAVTGGLSFVALSVGSQQSCGVIAGGVAYCWGRIDATGAIGECAEPLGPVPCSTVPVAVADGLRFAALSKGGGHACGLTTGGAAYCWGSNDWGQLGNGTQTSSSTPVAVVGGLTFASVSAGASHTCGVTTGGAAYCWGNNGTGQLGIGAYDLSPHATPLTVPGGLSFAALSAGSNSTCGVTTGGAVYCWGFDGRGVPVVVQGSLAFATVSVGGNACGLTTGGAAYCWGDNTFGQLGNGSFNSSATPVAVAGGLTFASVSVGSYHTCGVTANGVGYCWGYNGYGQLGNGSETAASAIPVVVAGQPSP